jgi:glutamate formiminotransferase
MNLLDTSVTSLARAWHEVEDRARAAGVGILRGELIGLMPLDAAVQVAADALRLEGLSRDRIIESHFIE